MQKEAETSDRSSRPGPDSTFTLGPDVKLEPLGDGSAVLYSGELDQSLSLNHTAALLCTYADGQHTLAMILQEMRHVFPQSDIEESLLVDFFTDLKNRKFIKWS